MQEPKNWLRDLEAAVENLEQTMASYQAQTGALQVAIDDLYVVFSSYKLRAPVEGCSCCVSSEDKKRLVSKPLRQLTEDDLGKYSFKAMTTWGDEYDFKHFLPRLLELLATGNDLFLGVDFLPNKLNYAQWQTWPDDEKHAVENVLLALWNYGLAGGETGDSMESWFSAIAQVVDDVTPFLQVWDEDFSPHSCQILLSFIEDFYTSPVNPQIRDWLQSYALLQLFERRFDQSLNDEEADLYARIVDALTNFRYVVKVKNEPTSNEN